MWLICEFGRPAMRRCGMVGVWRGGERRRGGRLMVSVAPLWVGLGAPLSEGVGCIAEASNGAAAAACALHQAAPAGDRPPGTRSLRSGAPRTTAEILKSPE